LLKNLNVEGVDKNLKNSSVAFNHNDLDSFKKVVRQNKDIGVVIMEVERFEEVLKIDPKNAEAYIYLTDAYLSQDKVEKGIETLEKYKSLVENPIVLKQLDDYINDIRNKN
jgi:tetratricopeptide (TPR) repeat protein